MAFIANLNIEGRSYQVMECDYEFSQEVDVTGRVSDRPRGGLINVVIVSPDDSDLSLHEWMRDKETLKSGSLVLFVNRDATFASKTVRFDDAYCVRLYEYFNNQNSMPMYTKISIMAQSIIFGDDCEFKMID